MVRERTHRARRAALDAAAAFALVALLAAAPLLAGLRYQGIDHSRILLGMQCALRRGLSGGLALDPALGGGGPLLAEPQSGVFYPPSWLLLPFGAETAASLFVVLHLALAAAGAVALGASLGLRRPARLALGIGFALCGTLLSLILHGPFLAGAAWLPWAWFGARALLRGHPVTGLLCSAFPLALMLVSGDPQGFGICVFVVALEVVHALAMRRPRPWRAALLALGAVVAGLLLGGLQLAPAIGLRAASARATGVDSTLVGAWPLELPEAIGIAWPVDSARRVRDGASLRTAWLGDALAQPSWNTSPLLGLAAIAAALAGFALRRHRAASLAALVFALLSLGAQTPLFGLARTLVPPLSLFRYPARYFLAASLALLAVAASTLELAARHARLRRRVALALGIAVLASLAACAFVLSRAASIDLLALRVAPPRGAAASSLPLLSTSLVQAGLYASLLGAASLLAFAAHRRRALLPFLVPLPLLAAAPQLLPVDEPLLAATAARSSLGGPETTMLCHGHGLGSVHVDFPGEPLGVRGDLLPVLHDLLPHLQQCGGPAVPDWYLASSQRETIALARDRLDEAKGAVGPAIALGCTHLVTRASVEGPALVPAEDAPPLPFLGRLYGLATPLPQASVVSRPQRVASGAEAVELVSLAHSAEDVLRVVDDPLGESSGMALPDGDGARIAQLSFDGATRAQLRLEGQGGAVVALRRPWWPGWSASQAGAPLPVVRAGAVSLAVVVAAASAGPVELAYAPPLLHLGFGLALAGAALLAGLLALARRRA